MHEIRISCGYRIPATVPVQLFKTEKPSESPFILYPFPT